MLRGLFRSRGNLKTGRNLGVIPIDPRETKIFRDKKLDRLDQYYENTQYNKLAPWDAQKDAWGYPVGLREKQPRMKVAYAKTLSQRLTAKLIGASVFPNLIIQDFPDDQAFIRAVVRESKLKAKLIEPVRRMLNTGSVFVRYYIESGAYKFEWYHAKYCYPTFQGNGELETVVVKYVFDDKEDTDNEGKSKRKWYKLEIGMNSEVLFDNPDYEPNVEPVFEEVARVDHESGFVQGEWFKTCDIPNSIDGYGLTADITDFVDELNYSLSQSSQAVSYNQDPQLVFSKMTEDETEGLIRSVTKSWNLGREGEAKFLESNLAGVERAIELRDKVKLNVQDITRIILLDPEKIVGNAQSAKAMEVLHGPLKDLIDELRMPMEDRLKAIILKMALSTLIANDKGIQVPFEIPKGYRPQSLDLTFDWPPVFQQTIEDLQKKVAVASGAATASIISREAALRWLSKDFNIEDIELELQRIAAQPVINPFGGF